MTERFLNTMMVILLVCNAILLVCGVLTAMRCPKDRHLVQIGSVLLCRK